MPSAPGPRHTVTITEKSSPGITIPTQMLAARAPQAKMQLTNIGITHVFSCINICRAPRMLFEHEADRPSVQHHPRDPASVNAMKQTCVIVILAYFTLFQLNSH